KGKGFQGGMKACCFICKEASHGVERKHRSPGSIGGHGSEAGNSGGVKKGKRMARRLGGFTTTTRNLDVVSVDAERGLLIVKGTVPGPNRGIVTVREAVRLNRRKQTAVKAG
ncbi:MAG: 50S ribosomal protein L3, partial [Phycisphaerales bacterium]|nr:50S ribosomal protein L3 [Phycisphaerales bacterium]